MVVLSRGILKQAAYTSFGVGVSSSTPCLGKQQTFIGDKGGKYVPGIFRINPVTISKTEGSCSSVNIVIPYQYFSNWYYDHKVIGNVAGAHEAIVTCPPVPVLHPEVSLNRSLAKLSKPELDVGLMIGELSETVNMLRQPLSSLYPLVKDMRKFARSRHKQKPSTPFSKVLSSAWLEYCYGILPLLADVAAVKEQFEKKRVNELEVLRRQAASTAREQVVPASSSGATGYYTLLTLSAEAYSSRRVTTHVYYKYNEWASNFRTLTNWGVNPFQLVDIGYAISPYSFVVNWFGDIGSWLKAIQPRPQLDIIGGCTTIKTVQSKRVTSYMAKSQAGSSNYVPCNSQFDWSKTQLDRVLQTTWQAPPVIGSGIDTMSKAVNSAAMLWQRIPLKW